MDTCIPKTLIATITRGYIPIRELGIMPTMVHKVINLNYFKYDKTLVMIVQKIKKTLLEPNPPPMPMIIVKYLVHNYPWEANRSQEIVANCNYIC